MPKRAAKPCAYPGCPNLVRSGGRYCKEHKRERRVQSDAQRGTAAQRGYGARWRRLRKMILSKQPLCADPFGVHAERGEIVVATEVDHIVPKKYGGTDAVDNLQALCKSCHSRKTRGESGGRGVINLGRSTIPVTIVAGPPGAGKTSYVAERAKWGDLIVDVDALYHALSGLAWYEKPEVLLPFVCEARDAVLARLSRESEVRHAWIITAQADKDKLYSLRDTLGAGLIVLEVDALECIRRISRDERRADRVQQWRELVYSWWRKYGGRGDKISSG